MRTVPQITTQTTQTRRLCQQTRRVQPRDHEAKPACFDAREVLELAAPSSMRSLDQVDVSDARRAAAGQGRDRHQATFGGDELPGRGPADVEPGEDFEADLELGAIAAAAELAASDHRAWRRIAGGRVARGVSSQRDERERLLPVSRFIRAVVLLGLSKHLLHVFCFDDRLGLPLESVGVERCRICSVQKQLG